MLKRLPYRILLGVLCCLNIVFLHSQDIEYPIRVFTKTDGLRYDFKSILQDKQDFIWIRYRDEIQRFDGANMKSFLKGERKHSLILDDSGVVWVSSGQNIYKFNSNHQVFEKVENSSKIRGTKILLKPYDDTFQFVSDSGIYEYQKKSNTFIKNENRTHTLDDNIKIRSEYVSNFKHVLYYKVGDSICQQNLKSGQKSYKHIFEIRNVLAQSEEAYIVSNWESKAWYYNSSSDTMHKLFLDENEPSIIVFDAIPIPKNKSYLATSKGLLVYNSDTGVLTPLQLSLNGVGFPVQRFNAIYQAKENEIWACTENSLLNFRNNNGNFHFIHGDYEDEKFTTDIRRFVADDQGNLWLATINGLVYWDLKQQNFSTIYAEENANDKLNHPSIRGLVYDGTYLIIGQTNKGIWLYNPKIRTFKRPSFENSETGQTLRKKSEQDFVNDIKTLESGNHLVSARDGAYLIDGNTYAITEVDFPGKDLNVKFSYQDTKGNIFIGTLGGLFCLDSDFNFKYAITKTSEIAPAYAILETSDGYYIGTMKGVYFLTEVENNISIKSVIPELKQLWIRTVFKDNLDNIWFVSESDIHRYNPKTEIVNTFGFTENVLGDFFHRGSFYPDKDGRVYIGGTNGINYFHPEQINLQSRTLYPYIKTVHIPNLDSVLPNLTTPKLQYTNNNIQIEVSAPYFGNHKDINYRYQLTENDEWYDLGTSNYMNLRGLASGDYNFKIAASLDSKEWHVSENTFKFKIRPPFWKRLWFVALALGLIVFTLFKLNAFFKRKLKTEQLLNGFATSLYGQSTVDGILWDTARYCVQELNFVDCIIYLIDKKRQVLVQKAAFGIKNPFGKEIVNRIEIPFNEGIVGSVASSAIPELITNTDNDSRYILDSKKALSEITVPIMVEGKVFAVLDSEHPKRNFYKRYHLQLLKKIAAICSERLTKYLSEENLRSEIARDLHDEMGSTLTSIHIISKMAEQDVKEDSHIKKQFNQINRYTSGMMDKMSDMVWVVNPANDSLDKLIYRIREFAIETLEPASIAIKFKEIEGAQDIKINAAQRKNIYLIAKEAISNAVKHSNADRVSMIFKNEGDYLVMCIEDNGKGFNSKKEFTGNGLKNLQSRSNEINSKLIIESSENNGVSICLKMNRKALQIINS
ncbi:GAF domain-containing protein [uncultured Aquimarina sp.]|uniref:sensor histidine kinase n=1 Tax=uncultured Aquimarina sp. TaxID=575652 RepID=UPI0026053D90|nr:GAF domain-containing protein [uncultured Aquimarina sp.]